MEKPQIYTPSELSSISGVKKETTKESNFNMSFLTEINKGISGLNSLLTNFQKAKALTGSLTGQPDVNSNQNIQTKIEKGVDNRIKNINSSKEPQKKPKIAIHIGNATKEFIGFTDIIFGNLDDKLTVGEQKKQLKDNMSEDALSPMVEQFLIKHTEIYYE